MVSDNMCVEKALSLISNRRIMRLGTFDGRWPHLVPLAFVVDGRNIYFECDYNSKKVRNIQRDNKVAILIDEYNEVGDTPYYSGVAIFGVASTLEFKSPEFLKARELLYRKYPYFEKHFPILPNTGRIIIKIEVENSLHGAIHNKH
jgi:nitroimidazol reductase NimA-like FMN-containing flavoprotein (pyridoxamine 5'-phosphate oxidase superfamily)